MKTLYWLITLCLSSTTVVAQRGFVTVYTGGLHQQTSPQPHNGFAVLTGGDSLKGLIKLKQYSNSHKGIVLTRSSADTFILYKDLQKVRLYDYDSSLLIDGYTDFVRLNEKEQLWRQLSRGSTEFFDELPYTNEKNGATGSEIVVRENGTVTSLFNFWSSSTKKDVVDYINKRFGQHFKKRNFRSTLDAIQYVLIQEKDRKHVQINSFSQSLQQPN